MTATGEPILIVDDNPSTGSCFRSSSRAMATTCARRRSADEVLEMLATFRAASDPDGPPAARAWTGSS